MHTLSRTIITRTRLRRTAVAGAVLAVLLPLTATGASGADEPLPDGVPQPGPSSAGVPGPSPADVLAVDPRSVPAPALTAAALQTPCPPATGGALNDAPGTGRTVALTFDDGPGRSTAQILTILEQAGVTATFFNLGVNAATRPETVREEDARDFLVANHTWDHADLRTLSSSGQAAEMDRASSQQVATLGYAPCAFRPPYGSYSSTALSLANARRMAFWLWSVDTEDWKANGSASSTWVNRIVSRAEAGGSQTHPVILFHNQPGGNPATVLALPQVIAYYQARGYAFVDLVGRVAAKAVVGDWDGDGDSTAGLVHGNTWLLRNTNSTGAADLTFRYGSSTDRKVVGDWDGNGTVTPGVVRGNTWYLRNSNSTGDADVVLQFGSATDRPVVGDWDGDGTDTPGVFRRGTWFLRNSSSTGVADLSFAYGVAGATPLPGDWDGNGTDTPGTVRGNTWQLRNLNSSGSAQLNFSYGSAPDQPLTGDWDGNGSDAPAVVRRGAGWFLRGANSTGDATASFTFGP
jgi:peptidoglycan/xylan/chitin deacetylase (PgdA/CDA1 family)